MTLFSKLRAASMSLLHCLKMRCTCPGWTILLHQPINTTVQQEDRTQVLEGSVVVKVACTGGPNPEFDSGVLL